MVVLSVESVVLTRHRTSGRRLPCYLLFVQTVIQNPLFFKGALNKDIFESYLEKVLAPSLRPGDIVVMDTECAQIAESGKNYQFLSC